MGNTQLIERVLCLDVGQRRIGVAVSDSLGIMAQGVTTIQSRGAENDYAQIDALAAQYGTRQLVIGLPMKMDGAEGEQAQRTRAFAQGLAERGYQIAYQDERFSTGMARRVLLDGDVSRAGRKDVIDMLAATLILQAYIDRGGLKQSPPELKAAYRRKDTEMDTQGNNENIVTLFDESERPVRFEHVMTLEHEGDFYVLLVPIDEIQDVEEDELIIMRIVQEDGEDVYVGVEDEALLETLFERYLEIAETEDLEDEQREDED